MKCPSSYHQILRCTFTAKPSSFRSSHFSLSFSQFRLLPPWRPPIPPSATAGRAQSRTTTQGLGRPSRQNANHLCRTTCMDLVTSSILRLLLLIPLRTPRKPSPETSVTVLGSLTSTTLCSPIFRITEVLDTGKWVRFDLQLFLYDMGLSCLQIGQF